MEFNLTRLQFCGFCSKLSCSLLQAGLIETNGELKVFIDQNLSPSKGIFCVYFTEIVHM